VIAATQDADRVILAGQLAAAGILKRAGIDAFDSGRDVRKLGGYGIRLKEAAFDPARRRSDDILASILGGAAIPPMFATLDPDRD
jgi:hypothetical protein